MNPNVRGVSAVVELSVRGGGAGGLPPPEDLAVDATEDLATDRFHDLLVVAGVSWVGASATQQLSSRGISIQILGESL